MSEKIKLHWVWREKDPISNTLGYGTHNRNMREFSKDYVELDENSNMALHIVSADHFCPQPGKKNILFTMWEYLKVPETYQKALALADVVIVPSAFCRDIFKPYVKGPIYVCHEGIDPGHFKYHPRRFPAPGQRLRILWVGAPNQRKGYPLVQEAIKVYAGNPSVEFYLKTTMKQLTILGMIRQTWIHKKDILYKEGKRRALWDMWRLVPKAWMANTVRAYGKYKNVIMDTRKISIEELEALYNSAHIFVLPSLGEGWGLTLCEAMATGCPSVAIDVTGCKEFFDEQVGYTIRTEIKDLLMENYQLTTPCYIPDSRHFVIKIGDAIMHYEEALKRGRKASERIHSKYTWPKACERLYEILKKEQIPYKPVAPVDAYTAQDILFNKDRDKILADKEKTNVADSKH